MDFEDKLDFVEVDINGIYSYRDDDQFKQRVYVTDDRTGEGIQVYGYASTKNTTIEEETESKDIFLFTLTTENK